MLSLHPPAPLPRLLPSTQSFARGRAASSTVRETMAKAEPSLSFMAISASGNQGIPRAAPLPVLQHDAAKKPVRVTRWLLMWLAMVVLFVSFRAGLNPPGWFWREDSGGRPVLRDEHWERYLAFNCLIRTAFLTSLANLVLLLMFDDGHAKVQEALKWSSLASLVGAYIAGAPGDVSFTVGIFVVALLICVVIYMATPEAEGD